MKDIIKSIINDTLKIDGKWSRTSLTMATAWWSCLFTFFYHLFKDGFDETSFALMLGIALGSKVTDAWGKSMINKQEDNQDGKV